MNERIRELYLQAVEYSNSQKTFSETREYFAEKFAELIVRECARVAQQQDVDCSVDYNSGRTWAGIDVLKHFGVEQ